MFDFLKKEEPVSFPDDRTDYDKTNQEDMREECNICFNMPKEKIVAVERSCWGHSNERTLITYWDKKDNLEEFWLDCSRAQHNKIIEKIREVQATQ